MAMMGMHSLIIEDAPEQDGYWVLRLSLTGATWERADDLAGLGVYEAAPKLIAKYGDKVAISLIGPGGEMQLKSAGVQNIDKDRVPSRINARGGLGAVMGSKGLKAIVFDHAGGQKPPIVSPEAFKSASKDYTKAVLEHPQLRQLMRSVSGHQNQRFPTNLRWLRFVQFLESQIPAIDHHEKPGIAQEQVEFGPMR